MMNGNTGTVASLIAADKVKDATVFNRKGEKLGTIDDILIDRTTGRAIYAVLSFGGFLGMNEKHHPMPWATLAYDTKMGGYVVDLDKKILEAAPNCDSDGNFEWTAEYGRKVDKYYSAPGYWM